MKYKDEPIIATLSGILQIFDSYYLDDPINTTDEPPLFIHGKEMIREICFDVRNVFKLKEFLDRASKFDITEFQYSFSDVCGENGLPTFILFRLDYEDEKISKIIKVSLE